MATDDTEIGLEADWVFAIFSSAATIVSCELVSRTFSSSDCLDGECEWTLNRPSSNDFLDGDLEWGALKRPSSTDFSDGDFEWVPLKRPSSTDFLDGDFEWAALRRCSFSVLFEIKSPALEYSYIRLSSGSSVLVSSTVELDRSMDGEETVEICCTLASSVLM